MPELAAGHYGPHHLFALGRGVASDSTQGVCDLLMLQWRHIEPRQSECHPEVGLQLPADMVVMRAMIVDAQCCSN